ncbi:MAG: PGL/p-HBAD biosynthesis glycosyltransferase [Chloroflexi bacterium]|nr:PGL/p-HBAD biosynthesis glycosyltransferase [Chloroflexota bacterium]
MTLVSIITPSYNQARFLEATLQSVLHQEYPNIEYIVVDGASTDGSLEIIKNYADRLAWWVSESDEGQAHAINKGFKQATGEIVAWLNSDDLYLPGTITKAVETFHDHPEAGMVFGDAVSADAEGRLLNHLPAGNLELRDLLRFQIITQPAVFMRRSILEEVNHLDPSYHFFLDHHLWIRMAREADIVHRPQTWAVSRYHKEAKNVYMADKCGKEAYRILAWAESQPDLAPLLREDSRRAWAGAHQINARYLLDGGAAWAALTVYLKAAVTYPPLLASFWHRLLFSALSLVGGGFLANWYYSWKNRRPPQLNLDHSLEGWPGIKLAQTAVRGGGDTA